MNTFTLIQRRFSARFFAALTIVSLLLTAFPAAFFVAEAIVPVDEKITVFLDPDAEPEFFEITFNGGSSLDLTGWTAEDSIGLVHSFGGVVLTDGDTLKVCQDVPDQTGCDENTGSGSAKWNNTGDTFKLFDYNGELIFSFSFGDVNDVAESLVLKPFYGGNDKFNICHATKSEGNPYNFISPNLNSFIGGHDEDTDDIIPPFFYDDGDGVKYFAGNNWDDDGKALFNDRCGEVVKVDGSLDITSPATDGETLGGEYTFEAEYVDEDDDDDTVAWAIRDASCELTTYAGNVGGFSNPFTFDGASFATTIDMSAWDDGEYCLVVNPQESGDGEDFRGLRTFFLENKKPEPVICSLDIVSDTSDFVVEKDANALDLTLIHKDWMSEDDLDATWIWGDDPVAIAGQVTVQTFVKKFGFAGVLTSATLEIASDNTHSAVVNGNLAHDGGSTFASAVSYDVMSEILQGNNELAIEVTNLNHSASPTANPAGLLYRLHIEGEVTDDEDCQIPYVEPEPEPKTPEVCSYEGVVVDYTDPAYQNDGDLVDANRRLTAAVEAGVAPYANFFGKEENAWQVNPLDFFSLGIAGELIYEFTDKIALDTAGDDIAIWEITGGPADEQAAEKVEVFVSQDGIIFVSVGVVTGDGSVDIGPAGLDFVKFVKLVDQSQGIQGDNGDGYDLDAITIIDESCGDFTTINASKIVCTDESDLPNGDVSRPISDTTASDWVETHDSCELVRGWEFEWAPSGANDPGDTLVGAAGGDWNTFVGSTIVPASAYVGGNFWMREVLQADYIPFTHEASPDNSDDFTAELYCSTDVLNYDNFDRVDDPQADEEYYCVAWNVPVKQEPLVCEIGENLLANGSFEEPVIRGSWALVNSIDWITTKVSNDDSTKLEIWRNFMGGASDGEQNVELGGTEATQVSQSVVTVPGATYELRFDFSARKGTGLAQNNIDALVDGSFLMNAQGDGSNESGNVWSTHAQTFVADTALTEITLADKGIDDLLGSLADNAVLCYVADPAPAPYCGDGIVQDDDDGGWEQCDGTDGCTDYCTLDNQCSDFRLVKITLDDKAPDSESFDGTLHLGTAGNVIPNGTWFNFDVDGDDGFVATGNAVEGLAIERDTDNDKLAIAYVGGNARKHIDYVQGTIMTKGIVFGAIDRAPNPSFKLEPVPKDPFEIIEDGLTEDGLIEFDLRADTGPDAVTVEIGQGDDYDCPACKATVEARIVVNDYGSAGEGDWDDEIILGDAGYSTVGFGEWFPVSLAPVLGDSAVMITDPNTVTNFASPGDKPGLFVSREGGTVKVALYGDFHPGGAVNNEWIDARIEVRDAGITSYAPLAGDYKLENHNGNVPSNDGFDEANADSTGVDFKLWVDTASDGFRFDIDGETIAFCEDDTVDTYRIDGYKYERGSDYVGFLSGWTIELRDDEGEFITSTTTDDEGYYYFDVEEGYYEVHEVMQEGWQQDHVSENGYNTYSDGELAYCEFEVMDYDYPYFSISKVLEEDDGKDEWIGEEAYECDFYNEQIVEMTHRIDGYKYDVTGDSSPVPYVGWTIYASNGGDAPISTTTDSEGYYYFIVEDGAWEVSESLPTDWIQDSVYQNAGLVETDRDVEMCEFEFGGEDDYEYRVQYEGYECDFYNEYVGSSDSEDEGSTTGTRISRGRPAPQVLGAATVGQCPFLLDYMQMGISNDPWEVTKLQLFLDMFVAENPVNGFFGPVTDANVKKFQEQYRDEILTPWYTRGIVPHVRPTGFVYKTTLWKINDIVCPDDAILPIFEGEDLTQNVDID